MNENQNKEELIEEIPKSRFTKIRDIGKGGAGEVALYEYKSPDGTIEQLRAIKIIKNYNKTRFDKETRPLLQLSHENIIKFFGKTSVSVFPALVLEYMGGVNLSDMIFYKTPDKYRYTLRNLLEWFKHATRALEYMHSFNPNDETADRKYIHRDVKPQNCLLSSDYQILKICDFGDSKSIENSQNTKDKGTYPYMAPEVLEGRRYNETIDVYSLMLTIWECLTGVSPFQECSGDLTKLGVRKKIENYLLYVNTASGKFNQIIQSCSSIDRTKRLPMKSLRCLFENMLRNHFFIEEKEEKFVENLKKENICLWNNLTGDFYYCDGLIFQNWSSFDRNPLLIEAGLNCLTTQSRQ